ncbi:MAG: restriction endonuclease [Nitrospinae bacterium]|nr:restriction endonuclease [Nitrospinota bacterium]
MPKKPRLSVEILQKEATVFAAAESSHPEKSLFGVTDGKAVGTYLEHKFTSYLHKKYVFQEGNSAKGIDFPELEVDIKVTSIKQPQSSCPFKSAQQKIFGLGYSLLVFVYEKSDSGKSKTARLNIKHVILVAKERTADFQITREINKILSNQGNKDDLIACLMDKNLPVDDIEANNIAEKIIKSPPLTGYLTISNALQWRLQYSRVIEKAGSVDGVIRLR